MAYIISTGVTSDNMVLENDSMTVLAGGTVDHITLNYRARLNLSSGGVADHTLVNSGGSLYVFTSGKASNTVMDEDGRITISGGEMVGTVLNLGRMYVSSGGTASHTVVNSDGILYAYVGGTLKDTVVNSGGSLTLSSSLAESLIVNQGGSAFIRRGASASIAFNPWQGELSIDTNATVTYLEREANVYYGCDSSGVIAKGNSFDSMVIESGNTAIVYSGGVLNGVRVNGVLNVEDGGTATVAFSPWSNGTVISGEGATVSYLERDAKVYYGGEASGLLLKSDEVSGQLVGPGNRMIVYEGGVADGVIVNKTAELEVRSGGTARLAYSPWDQGNVIQADGATVTISDERMAIYCGSPESGLVSCGNIMDELVVTSGNQATVTAGGVVSSVEVSSCLWVLWVVSRLFISPNSGNR